MLGLSLVLLTVLLLPTLPTAGRTQVRARSMKVTVKLGAPLSLVVGESKVILSLPEGATAGDVLELLRERYPEFEAGLQGRGLPGRGVYQPLDPFLYSLFLDARPVPWEQAGTTRLRDGSRLYLFLPVAGG